MLERILYLNDLGKCPRKSALLKLMQNKRIPKGFHRIIERSAPDLSFQQIKEAIEEGRPPTTHKYHELVTDEHTLQVTGAWEPAIYEEKAFNQDPGPFSTSELQQLSAIFMPYLIKNGAKLDDNDNEDFATLWQDLLQGDHVHEAQRPGTEASIGLGLAHSPYHLLDSESDLESLEEPAQKPLAGLLDASSHAAVEDIAKQRAEVPQEPKAMVTLGQFLTQGDSGSADEPGLELNVEGDDPQADVDA
jgi:hypothetical protein